MIDSKMVYFAASPARRCMVTATSARVALLSGSRVLSSWPVMIPLPAANADAGASVSSRARAASPGAYLMAAISCEYFNKSSSV